MRAAQTSTMPASREGEGAAPFKRDPARSHGDHASENAIVHGENLEVMRRLAASGFAGRFRCIYFDPPFNTGRRFAEYDDALDPAVWLAAMKARLAFARELLAMDGAIFVEIDDTELGPLLVTMDAIFGRENRAATITVVRSAATGHKAINRGPVNVADYLLVYARDRALWRPKVVLRERGSYDRAYGTWLENPADPPDAWRFVPLAGRAREKLGGAATRTEVERFAMDHAEHVVRFAQPRYDAVSRAARVLIDASRADPARVMSLPRKGRKPLVLRGGNRVLRLADKVGERG
jgi:adenine-specific DNA-methyltransferase